MVIDMQEVPCEADCRSLHADACHSAHNVPADRPNRARTRSSGSGRSRVRARLPRHEAHPVSTPRRPSNARSWCSATTATTRPACGSARPRPPSSGPDGIVMMDLHRCIGCRFCMAACPYGARSFNWYGPAAVPQDRPIKPEFPTRTKGVVEKCNFCDERLAEGKMPACVEASQGANWLTFGDLDDPDSEVRAVAQRPTSLSGASPAWAPSPRSTTWCEVE